MIKNSFWKPIAYLNGSASTDKKVMTVAYAGTLAFIVPAAIITSPSKITSVFDCAMGVLIPIHAAVGVKHVVEDYVPRAMRSNAMIAVTITAGVSVLGLTALNIRGLGITETVLSLWRSNPPMIMTKAPLTVNKAAEEK